MTTQVDKVNIEALKSEIREAGTHTPQKLISTLLACPFPSHPASSRSQ